MSGFLKMFSPPHNSFVTIRLWHQNRIARIYVLNFGRSVKIKNGKTTHFRNPLNFTIILYHISTKNIKLYSLKLKRTINLIKDIQINQLTASARFWGRTQGDGVLFYLLKYFYVPSNPITPNWVPIKLFPRLVDDLFV